MTAGATFRCLSLIMALALSSTIANATYAVDDDRDTLSLKQFTDILAKLYGDELRISAGFVSGTTGGGKPFNHVVSPDDDNGVHIDNMMITATPISAGYGPCTTPIIDQEDNGVAFVRWCEQHITHNGSLMEAKRDIYIYFSSADFVYFGSQYLDCDDAADLTLMTQTVRFEICAE